MSEVDLDIDGDGPDRPTFARELVMTAAATFGALCLVCVAASTLLGVTPLIVTGSSMSPNLPVGSLAVAVPQPADDVRTGDVVSVVRNDGTRVTHRVVDTTAAGEDSTALTLRGDANESPDAERYVVTDVDTVRWSVPVLGSVLTWATTSTASFLLGLSTALVLGWAFAPGRTRRVGAVLRIPVESS